MLRSRLRSLRRPREYKSSFRLYLTIKAHPIYLGFCWVECQFKALASCPQSEDLLEQLLDSLPQTLDETYELMLSSIPSSSKKYVRQVPMILCCAKRPLTVVELIDGIAVQLDETPRFNQKRKLKNSNAIHRVCSGFIELDGDTKMAVITPRQTLWYSSFFENKEGLFEDWVTTWYENDWETNYLTGRIPGLLS